MGHEGQTPKTLAWDHPAQLDTALHGGLDTPPIGKTVHGGRLQGALWVGQRTDMLATVVG